MSNMSPHSQVSPDLVLLPRPQLLDLILKANVPEIALADGVRGSTSNNETH